MRGGQCRPFLFMNFIRIKTFDNYIEANMIAGILENEGIKSFLQDEFTVTIDPILSNAIGGIKLVVPEEDAARALELLKHEDERKQKLMACPKCGAKNVEYVSVAKARNWLTAIATFILGSYAAAPEKKYHCFSCGYEFDSIEGIINPDMN